MAVSSKQPSQDVTTARVERLMAVRRDEAGPGEPWRHPDDEVSHYLRRRVEEPTELLQRIEQERVAEELARARWAEERPSPLAFWLAVAWCGAMVVLLIRDTMALPAASSPPLGRSATD